jgi:hypothetical protein
LAGFQEKRGKLPVICMNGAEITTMLRPENALYQPRRMARGIENPAPEELDLIC